MTKTISKKQLAANRNNAKKSSGPRTNEGKARVSYNALKHGLTAERLLLPGENAEEFEEYRADLIEYFSPEGPLEAEFAERVATLFWRLKRVPAFEAALYEWMEHFEIEQEIRAFKPDHLNPRSLRSFTASIAREVDEDKASERETKLGNLEIGRALEGMFNSGLFDKVIRYDRALQRQLKETLNALLELQQKRFDRDKEKKTQGRSFSVAERPVA
jgi:hypothetical protein